MDLAENYNTLMDGWRAYEISRDQSCGHIYAVEFDDGIVKIGRTQSPEKRMYSLTQFRGKRSLKKVYISGMIPHSYIAERLAMRGLTPCDGRECFKIPFEQAVERVKSVAGEAVFVEAYGFENISKIFKGAVRPEIILENHFERLFELMKKAMEVNHATI